MCSDVLRNGQRGTQYILLSLKIIFLKDLERAVIVVMRMEDAGKNCAQSAWCIVPDRMERRRQQGLGDVVRARNE